MTIKFGNTDIELLAEKAVYVPDSKALVIGDVHIGKTTDMLKEGIQVPIQIALSNPYRIGELLKKREVRKCYFLGDLFHSRHNPEFGLISELIDGHPSTAFILVRGNHEILSDEEYVSLGLETVHEALVSGLLLKHHPDFERSVPMLSAHIHPKVTLSGKGRQRLRLAVFARQGNCFVLPAFGAMTGGYTIDKEEYDSLYLVAEQEVIRLK